MGSNSSGIEVTTDSAGSVSFSGKFKDQIFNPGMTRMRFPRGWDTNDVSKNWDSYNSYSLNNYGYRGPDFRRGIDILAAGCSLTYGVGVPENGTWASHLATLADRSYCNLSAPGVSIDWITNQIYRFIYTFGPPKNLFVVFPDLIRGEDVIDDWSRVSPESSGSMDFNQQSWNLDQTAASITRQFIRSTKEDLPKYMRRPYEVEYTSSVANAIRVSVREIRQLELFCKHAGINLAWSTWSDDLAVLVQDLPVEYEFDNFVFLEGLHSWESHVTDLMPTTDAPDVIVDRKIVHKPDWSNCQCSITKIEDSCIEYSMCHFDLEKNYGLSFHAGTDRFRPGNSTAHIGVHKHIHIAETFIDRVV